ncbi:MULTISPECIES: hypothetical protein [Nitrosomonas]|uniref:Uncharacterized protein n=1 Tax=Nitrosomonas communis TaxID=44574 RepID=A0A0F7KI92_9PROT|nr:MULTISPECIES: hypothetical protein [Nitrosomonas]AKH38833.1 hypothetical protein AAW31_15120 [Nitrosomonas communis]TYP79885.1 hypothetical protein BCL69_10665 [Nitrosomonas communis]UVS60948.1 hypothetical protein NX761_15860 [Nitrosomonas sp. PLL12]
MNRKKYRNIKPGGKQIHNDASAQNFAMLLRNHIPPFVIAQLRPIKEKLRNNAQGFAETEWTAALHAEISSAAVSNDTEWKDWSNKYLTAFAKMDDSGFTDSFKQIPDPPPEPPELWLRLATQAKEAGNKGIAACLLLYTLACARALREFRVGKHTNGDEPNFTQREG